MQKVGLSPDTFTYCNGQLHQGRVRNLVNNNIMIALQAKESNYPSAVKLYRDMQAAGFRRDKITYSIVMEFLGHSDGAEFVSPGYATGDWTPDKSVYGLLADMWGKAGHVECYEKRNCIIGFLD